MRPQATPKLLAGTTIPQLVLAAVFGLLWEPASAADWPTFRHDMARSGATDEKLPTRLHLQWSRQLPELIPSWLGEFPHLRFDANYEPIVAGKTLYFASSDDDSVTALDTRTGGMRWRFYVNGPVRLAPVAHQGKIYFGAEEGTFYCLDGQRGTLQWQFDTALADRKGLIEGRLTTISPIRGGPVIDNDQVHFAAGIWSWEPSAVFTLDAQTGTLVRQTPNVRAQGYLSAIGSWLYFPNGRAGGFRLTRPEGKWAGGFRGWAGYWDHLVTGEGEWLVRMGSLQKVAGKPTGQACEPGPGLTPICFYRPIFADKVVYYSAAGPVKPRDDKLGPEVGDIVAASLQEPTLVEAKDEQGKPVLDRRGKPQTKLVLKELWRVPHQAIANQLGQANATDKAGDLLIVALKAADRLYGYHGSTVFALDLPTTGKPASVSWKAHVEGTPARMLAADGKLFVVTRQGRLYAFGSQQAEQPKVHPVEEQQLTVPEDHWTRTTRTILEQTKTDSGYCLVLGLKSGRMIEEVFRQSRLHIIAMDPDPSLVHTLREKLYHLKENRRAEETKQVSKSGTTFIGSASGDIDPRRRRIVITQADPLRYPFPPYLASLIVTEDPQRLTENTARIAELYEALRPYGGAMCLALPAADHQTLVKALSDRRLPKAELQRSGEITCLTRVGALPGAANWTDEWADAANTLKSRDQLRFPLGMLWTGGRSARRDMYFDRHYVPPAPVVIDGRMFITGPDRLVAIDIYTGRILWEVRSKAFTAMTRGAGGCHTLGTKDSIYVSNRQTVFRFDPATGKLLWEIGLPKDHAKGAMWGRARVHNNMLIASLVSARHDRTLLAMDRHYGEVIWSIDAESSFSHVAIGNDKVFCWDGSALDLGVLKANRRGQSSPAIAGRSLRAFDANTGKELWRVKTDSVVDWLSYSESLDVLIASTKKRIVAYCGRDGGQLWKKFSEGIGFLGHPGRVWQKVILWHDWLIDQRGPGLAYDLSTGKPVERPHPVTLEPVPWEFIRHGHHCNHAIASENLLTFRAGNATLVDLTTLGTGTFPGYRTGCTNSLVVAGGLLNSPMYAHLCICGYEFFTSLAFAPMPEVESWTYRPNKLDFLSQPELGRARRLGLNFNAPGERQAANGTLWFGLGRRQGYALSGISVSLAGTQPYELPEGQVQGPGPAWIFATGLEGLKSFTVPLAADKSIEPAPYAVRLYFLDPSASKVGERVFSVKLGGKTVLEDFDVLAAAGSVKRGVVKELTGVQAGASLTVELTPKTGVPVISGIEVLAEPVEVTPPEVHHSVVKTEAGAPVDVKLSYSDFDGPGPYTFKITRPPAKGALTGTGPLVSYESKPDATGTDRFAWVVNDGAKDSPEAMVTIKLSGPNLAPKARDTTIQTVAGRTTEIVLPFSDPDEQPGNYHFEIVRLPTGGSAEWQTFNRLTYVPRPDFVGEDSLTWKVTDGAADSNVATMRIRVAPDTEPPHVAAIDSAGPGDRITVVFSEPVSPTDARNPASYQIEPGVTLKGVELDKDGRTVRLATSPLEEGQAYALVLGEIRDLAARTNITAAGTRTPFEYTCVGNGLLGEYFAGEDFAGKKVGERVDPYIEFNWRKDPPFPEIELGTAYSVRWTGRLKADHSERYTFDVFKGWEHNRNPVRIWLDGKLLANESTGGAAVESGAFGTVELQAGKVYDLKVELSITRPRYSQYADIYALRWSSLSTPRQTIPQSNLGHRPRASEQ